MNLQSRELGLVVDRFVSDRLHLAEIVQPPVDVVKLAQRLGLVLIYDQSQHERGRMKKIEGEPVICIRPEIRPERLQWTVAHELGEIWSAELAQLQAAENDELATGVRESWANLIAQRLLIPTSWFQQAMYDTAGDLIALKERFITASHELLAWRMLDWHLPTIIAIYDQGKLTRRRVNHSHLQHSYQTEQKKCRQRVASTRKVWQEECMLPNRMQLHLQGWPINDITWNREILRLTLIAALDDDHEFIENEQF